MDENGTSRRRGREAANPALRALAERLARGEIGVGEYASRRAALESNAPSRGTWRRPRRLVAAAVAGVALAGAALGVAAAAGPGPWYAPWSASRAECAAPAALPGQVVDVTVTDRMGGMMGGQGSGPMTGGGWRGQGPGGMMRVLVSPASVPAGVISFRVRNTGALTHELVVLPLAAGQLPGSRPVGPDGTVSEVGSLGEASATCAAGHGDGIAPGAAGWVSLTLHPGRYELICNLPGHYARGMHAELDVR